MDSRRFIKFARERGVSLGGGAAGEGIERLWRMGWLLADLVRVAPGTSESILVEWAGDGFVLVREEGGSRLYADARAAGDGIGTVGVGGAPKAEVLPQGIKPFFHPFRYHVLHFVDGTLRLSVTSLSTLATAGSESLTGLYGQVLGYIDERVRSPESQDYAWGGTP